MAPISSRSTCLETRTIWPIASARAIHSRRSRGTSTVVISVPLQLQVLERRRVVVQRDPVQARLRHPRPDTVVEEERVDRQVEHALVRELLDAVQQGLALLAVELARLLREEIVHVGMAAR